MAGSNTQNLLYFKKNVIESNAICQFIEGVRGLRPGVCVQSHSWSATVQKSIIPTPNKHLKQLIKVLIGILETSRQVC